jgi:hypothetical protein
MNWISVKDRLPDIDTPVLAFVNYNQRGKSDIPSKGMEIGELCEFLDDDYTISARWGIWDYIDDEFEVLYWMPLPDAPIEFKGQE